MPLIIVLSSVSRTFLRFICRGLRGIYAGYTTIQLPPGDARIAYTEICQVLEASPVRVDVYEKFLAGVDSSVRQAYRAASYGEKERPGPENDLIVEGRIAGVLMPAVATSLRQTLPSLRPEIDRMAIYIADYSWLGFGSDPRSELYRRNRDVDILKKIQLLRTSTPFADGDNNNNGNNNNKGGNVRRCRRCVRCCQITGDTNFPRSMVAFRMFVKLGLLRACLCGGTFAIEPIVAGGRMPQQGEINTAR